MHIIANVLLLLIVTVLSSTLISCSNCHELNPENCKISTRAGQPGDFNGRVSSMVPMDDGTGDVYVAGEFTAYNGTATNYLIKLNADGPLAMAFPDGFDAPVLALSLARDGS